MGKFDFLGDMFKLGKKAKKIPPPPKTKPPGWKPPPPPYPPPGLKGPKGGPPPGSKVGVIDSAGDAADAGKGGTKTSTMLLGAATGAFLFDNSFLRGRGTDTLMDGAESGTKRVAEGLEKIFWDTFYSLIQPLIIIFVIIFAFNVLT